MFALDTNTLVYFFKGLGRVHSRLLALSPAEIAIPSVVVYELEIGIAQSSQAAKRRAQLDELMALTATLPFDAAAAKRAAAVSSSLRRTGNPIGPMDNLIAGTALANGATLVTHNTSEFRRVRGLALEDWY